MKVSRKYIGVSEFGFIISPEIFIGLKYIEVDLGKTIDSIVSVSGSGTNLLTMLPVVANEYYFLNHIYCNVSAFTIGISFTARSLDGGNVFFMNHLVCFDNSAAPGVAQYEKDLTVDNLFCCGMVASATWNEISYIGIKINTS